MLLRTDLRKNDANCLEYDFDIQEKSPTGDVLPIHHGAALKIDLAAARNLPQTGYAGAHTCIESSRTVVAIELFLRDGPGADNAHLPCKHVKELRQFI